MRGACCERHEVEDIVVTRTALKKQSVFLLRTSHARKMFPHPPSRNKAETFARYPIVAALLLL